MRKSLLTIVAKKKAAHEDTNSPSMIRKSWVPGNWAEALQKLLPAAGSSVGRGGGVAVVGCNVKEMQTGGFEAARLYPHAHTLSDMRRHGRTSCMHLSGTCA
mmetsp:Transcript_13863/g.22058  ORF Transcript_13863/g.22058 Transcript_13863/m.22058 type:complete len:102 (-) Transcript_13863:122-427(-)